MQVGQTTSNLFSVLAVKATKRSAPVAGDALTQIATGGDEASASGDGCDFTHMTPSEMQGVAQDLYDSDDIDLTQLLMLQTAGLPLGKLGENGELIPLSDAEKAKASSTPRNYLDIAQNAMKFLEDQGAAADPKSGYDQWKGIYAALQGASASFDAYA